MRTIIFDGGNYNNPSYTLVAAEIPRFSSVINNYQLTAGVARTISIPAGAEFCFFNCSSATGTALASYFMCDASIATAAIPTGDVTNGTGVEYNTAMRCVRQLTGISVIAPTNSFLTCSFYSRGDNTSTS
jgi:hypothetical protein